MKNTLILETPQLLLKPTQPEWLDPITKIEQANNAFIGVSPKSKHLGFINNDAENHFTVFRKEDREIVGYFILFDVTSKNHCVLLKRIAIATKGKGYGREVLKAIKKYCFEDLKIHRLWLDVYPDNARAIHVYESEGFKREGTMRESILQNGKYRDVYIYSILKNEYFI